MPLTSCVLLDDTSSLSLNLPFCKAGIMMPNFVGKLNNHTGKFPSTLMGETFYWVINSMGEVSEPTSDDCEICTFNFETFRNCWACGLENNFNKEECICPVFFGWSKKKKSRCVWKKQAGDRYSCSRMRWDLSVVRHWGDKGFSGSSVGKESACNAGDPGSIPGSGRSGSGGGYGNPHKYSCLENPHGQRSLGGLQSMWWQTVRYNWATFTFGGKKPML